MKNRVTLVLEDIPYRALKVMAATEDTTMSMLVEDFVMGTRQNVSLPPKTKIPKTVSNTNLPIVNVEGTPKGNPLYKDPDLYCIHMLKNKNCKDCRREVI